MSLTTSRRRLPDGLPVAKRLTSLMWASLTNRGWAFSLSNGLSVRLINSSWLSSEMKSWLVTTRSMAVIWRCNSMAGRNIGNAVNYVAAHRGNVPILKVILGVVLHVVFMLALMLQIQKSEAFILNASLGSLTGNAANGEVLRAPVGMLNGKLPLAC